MVCPGCEGSGLNFGLINRGERGCAPGSIPCTVCKGVGEITEEHQEFRERGEHLRQYRLGLGLSQREAANRAGVRHMEWSDMEQGRAEPMSVGRATEVLNSP